MLGITKRGDPYIRSLLIQGAMSVASSIKKKNLDEDMYNTMPILDAISKVSSIKSENKRLAPCRKRNKISLTKKTKSHSKMKWFKRLIEEKGIQKAAVAFANRNARLVWSLIKNREAYDPQRGELMSV